MKTERLISRRHLMASVGVGATLAAGPSLSATENASAVFKPSWESLQAHYKTPDWFRDAKFGIWAHWGPQCIPEHGDWYARRMYMQGDADYNHHLNTYGHPSQSGFMELLKDWRVDQWQPDRLLALYKKAGAKYFVAMACHHDNFDMYASKYHEWNVASVGPKRDFMTGWREAARKAGLRFGVSNHAAHAWHWLQTAYGYDPEGEKAGVRYDAFKLRKSDGVGKWWEGLDPQELYTGPAANFYPPDGITTIAQMNAYHDAHSGQWLETPPPGNPYYAKHWLARQVDLIEQHNPDFVFLDNYVMPLGNTGLEAVAQFYNHNLKKNGQLEAVITANALNETQSRALTSNVERGYSDHLRELPWQTCTCIGDWHYDRRLYDTNGYKTALEVIQRLADVVSKNGTLLLSVPVRADGSIDDKEEAILEQMAQWMAINGEAIFATRPWSTYGEGPFQAPTGVQNEGTAKPFTAEDIRFTTKEGLLYILGQAWPEKGSLTIGSLKQRTKNARRIEKSELLGHTKPLKIRFTPDGLVVELPSRRPTFTPVLKITGKDILTAAAI